MVRTAFPDGTFSASDQRLPLFPVHRKSVKGQVCRAALSRCATLKVERRPAGLIPEAIWRILGPRYNYGILYEMRGQGRWRVLQSVRHAERTSEPGGLSGSTAAANQPACLGARDPRLRLRARPDRRRSEPARSSSTRRARPASTPNSFRDESGTRGGQDDGGRQSQSRSRPHQRSRGHRHAARPPYRQAILDQHRCRPSRVA